MNQELIDDAVKYARQHLSCQSSGGEIFAYPPRTVPSGMFQPHLERYVEGIKHPIILDVGAGAITVLGYSRPGGNPIIDPVDVLAGPYRDMLNKLKIVPPVRTRFAAAESMVDDKDVPSDAYDFVYCFNAIDHMEDPDSALLQMLRAVKVGQTILIEGQENEGESNNYRGMHYHNFEIHEDELWHWQKGTERQKWPGEPIRQAHTVTWHNSVLGRRTIGIQIVRKV